LQRSTAIISSFSSGEVAPTLGARIDIAQYANSAQEILNGIVQVHGGCEKRPGTMFVGEVKDSSKKTYLVPFKFSTTNQCMLEFGNLYIRIYQNHALSTIPDIVTPYLTADLLNLNYRQSGDVVYLAHPNYPSAKLSRLSATNWQYEVISFKYGDMPIATVGPGTLGVVRITVNNHGLASGTYVYINGIEGTGLSFINGNVWPINVVDINNFDLIGSILPGWGAVSGPSQYLFNLDGLIGILLPSPTAPTTGQLVNVGGFDASSGANGVWQITVYDHYSGGTRITLNNSQYIGVSSTLGWVSLVSSYGYISGGSVTQVQPITGAANNGSGLIRITSANHGFDTGQGVNVIGVLGATEANGIWEIKVIDDNTYDLNGSTFTNAYISGGYGIPVIFATSNNYPSTVEFFEQRLAWAGTLNQPQNIWLSVTRDFENMITGTNDDDALVYALYADGTDPICWMLSWNVLLLGLVNGEWRFGGATITEPTTPTSILAKIQSNKGSMNIKAIMVGDVAIFIQYYGTKLYQIGYTFVSDTFSSTELTKLASHITKSGIVQMAQQETPNTVIWLVRNDGYLVSMTYYADEKVIAFSRHNTLGVFESIASLKGEYEDEIWVIVNRTIGGVTKRYIEYFVARDFTAGEPVPPTRPYQYLYADCGLTYDGGVPVTITGISQTSPAVVTYTGTNPTNGWYVKIRNVVGMTDVNDNAYLVANVNTGAKTFELSGLDSSAFSAYISGGTWEQVVNAVTGLDHLDGQMVDVCADGGALAPQLVVSGGISLGDYYNRVSAGLHYDYKLKPQPLEINLQTGTSAGIQKNIEKVTLRLNNTIGGIKIGSRWDKLSSLVLPCDGLFTGDVPWEFDGEDSDKAEICILHDQPLPATVLGIMTIATVQDR
jgi:hypothetical protein